MNVRLSEDIPLLHMSINIKNSELVYTVSQVLFLRSLLLLALLLPGLSTAAALIFDGDFESGTLQGWVPGNGGSAIVVRRGRCFSNNDTQALSIRGQYAGLLRSTKFNADKKVATLTSKKFIAGSGILFLALSEQKKNTSSGVPFSLDISILDADGVVLATHPLATATVALSSGCPSDANDARFSRHFISTQTYRGKYIRLRFSQHAETAQYGGFTLIDQITLVFPGETTISRDAPLAKAGIEYNDKEQSLYLLAALPGNVKRTESWRYNWHINGEDQPRNYYNPCINDLGIGHYTAILTVQNNDSIARDVLNFSINETGNETTDNGDESNQPVCNLQHPLDSVSNPPKQATVEQ